MAIPKALVDRSAQVDRPGRELEVFECPADVAGSNVEEPACVLVGESQVSKCVDHHVSQRRRLGRQLVQPDLPWDLIAVLGAPSLSQDHQTLSERRPRYLPEDPLLEVDRLEDRAMHEQHLGSAEKQVTVVLERVMEAPQDAALRLRGEVHEGVAADQEIET